MKKLLYTLLSTTLILSACKKDVESNINSNNNITEDLAIGDYHQGGIIFYLYENGGGLIAAPEDTISGDTSVVWGCYSDTITGAYGTEIGTGFQNTIDIQLGCPDLGIAADICTNLTIGGYSDWYLPSKNELNELYLNLRLQGIGGLNGGYYWSSTQSDINGAWSQAFYDTSTNGFQAESDKNIDIIYVRAIRTF